LDTLASLQTQINNLIPSQTGNAGKVLTTDGTDLSWDFVAGGLDYQGTWNASTNTPTLASGVGVNGYYYITATAGSTNLDGITDWEIGDWLLFNGTVWQKIDQSNLVTSVNGQTGAVSLTTTNINEGTNLYYTDARARSAISAGTGISYDSATGVVTNASPDQTVSLTGAGTTSISGTYPNFTITSADSTVGTVTSVSGTGTVSGISLSGTVTSSGNLTLGGTLDLSSPPTIGNTTPNTGRFTTLTVDDNTTLGSSNTDTVTFTARINSDFEPATDNAYDLGRTGHEWRNLYIDGTANIDSLIADTADINAGTIDNTSIGASTASTGSFTSLTDSGNLAFTGTGNRITGDFSNATVANRTLFQTSTANSSTLLGAIPNGTGTQSNLILFNASDPTNASTFNMLVNATEVRLNAGAAGSGTLLPMTFLTGGSERVRIDTSGNVGIGTSSPAYRLTASVPDNNGVLISSGNDSHTGFLYFGDTSSNTVGAVSYDHSNNSLRLQTAGSERMRIDSAGNVGIGTSSPSVPLQVAGTIRSTGTDANAGVQATTGSATLAVISNARTWSIQSSNGDSALRFRDETAGAERMRIDSSGNLLVGVTSTATPGDNNNTTGLGLNANGRFYASAAADHNFNKTADGAVIAFRSEGTTEGTISISGTTTSYNGGHLARWAQTITPKDDTLVKGTVLSNLDEMNVYTDAEGNPVENEQLNKVKVSDAEGDANVAGVFVNWEHDEAHNVDEINMAMTGDMIIRIAAGTTVQRGDLLMSAGDGTAKPQGDDIVRAKTIAKVTSTHVTCTYADGSFCVPCVLMAC
jgi:hypothetical protein